MKEELKKFEVEALDSNNKVMQGVLNSTMDKLTVKNDALNAMVILKEETKATMNALNTRIEELQGELVVCRAILGNRFLSATVNYEMDVTKLEKFKRARFAKDVDNFLSTDEKRGQVIIGTHEEFQKEFNERFTYNISRRRL
ncbi:hypothetical protein PVK06_039235 [Gossypium arboreum]|uniref:Uncharacterized protein n=1 Tax=Gossypium arboreum TaxID=29729 RepID=A0ABR0N543_GOSAR|nr:hypothetical protein PVK06_039235 [Gossypium arboreum]